MTEEISRYSIENGVAVIVIDSPPVNALGLAVRKALDEALRRAIADPAASAIVVRCDGRTFFAGGDITEFGRDLQPPGLNDIFALMDASAKPIVAAMHGTALGGGLELALACHYRVAVASAKVGLPEVSLGLLPGAGGTQRAPRLVGVAAALDLMVGGEPLTAGKAHEIGLIDLVVDGDLAAEAIAYAADRAAQAAPLPRVRDMSPDLDAEATASLVERYREANPRKFRGFKAPGYIVEAVQASVARPFDEGLALEKAMLLDLIASDESRAQRHIFFAERAAGKVPGLGAEARPADVTRVTVIGAGTMGSGIATAFLNIGLPVTLVDRDESAVERGASRIRSTIAALVAKNRIAEAEGARRTALLSTATDIAEAVGPADLVMEAIFEDLALKQSVFREIDAAAPPAAILATNTSFLDVDAIAAVTSRPERVVGLHFFAPANVMRLLEVVRGQATAADVVASGMALGRRLGKVAVLSGVCDGFIANRAMRPRMAAAEALTLEGPTPANIDRVMVDYGFAMGPFAMLDLVGLDVIGWDRENSAGRTVQELLCELGRWGQKTSCGYYDYDDKRKPTRSPVAEQVIADFAARTGIPQRTYSDVQIVERLLYPVVNEGAKILEEGIALRASDIDIALVTGYGWPVWTGGPMIWGDTVGLPHIVAALDRTIGAQAVSPMLRKLAADGGRLT